MELGRVADLLASAGQPDRLRILALVAGRPDGVTVGEIQSNVGLPASTLSYHLERLRRSGWVTIRRQGPFLWHRLSPRNLDELSRWLETLKTGAELIQVSAGARRKAPARAARARPRRRAPEPAVSTALEIEFD